MHMQSQVIVPLDGSAYAEAILPHALFFALQTQRVLILLRVIIPPGEPEYTVPYIPDDWYEGEVSWTKNYLTSLATRLQAQGASVQMQYLEGTFAGATITSYAEQHADVQLIALATHGRDAAGRLLLGSVAGDVFASAPTSLLLLHPPKDEQIPPGPITQASYQNIVVPFDGTALHERVLEQATTLALACHASVLLAAVPSLPPLEEEIIVDEIEEPLQRVPAHEEKKQADFLADQAEQLHSSTGLTVQTAVIDGDPEAFIERFYGQNQQHLLIVTTRKQAEHKVMRFLHQSDVPVLFVA
jgi:nucleotide-binding universal stress UspA family protein